MINLVRIALRRPYTMAIAAMLIVLMGFISVTRMVVDIFPTIDIPVVYVAWSFNGLNAEDMERRVVLVSERAYSTTVNGIDHIESLSIPGQGILKIYLPAGRRHRRRHRADLGPEQRGPAHRAARHAAAEHHPVQRVERAGACRSRSTPSRCRSRCSPTTPTSSCGCGCSPSRACRSRAPSAASSARSSSRSILRRPAPRACRRWTSSTRSAPPT